MKHIFKLIFFLIALSNFANNISLVGDVYLSSADVSAGTNNPANYRNILFNVAWDNSWRTDLPGTGNSAPYNFDAAWIFAKYRINGGDWHHLTMSQTETESEANTTILGVSDGKGVFLYNSENFTGNFVSNNNKIKWYYVNDGVNDDDIVEIKLYAIEMVYIPQGSFYLGTNADEIGSFKNGTSSAPYEVTSESAITISTSDLYYLTNQYDCWPDGNSGDRQGPIPDNFPKGYNGFFLMKYEITQQQYVDFLNSLTRTQQNYRTETDISGTYPGFHRPYVMSKSISPAFRNGIRCSDTFSNQTDPIEFYCDLNNNNIPNENDDGQNIACNFLSWADDAAYSDWAGLRPMTEMEYEKAARGAGQTPVDWEEAGGFDVWDWNYMAESNIVNNGMPNEVADRETDRINFWASRRKGEQQIGGPMRVGCFADNATSRVDATAGYYGNMNLSDNVYERVITVGNPEGRAFTGANGDGELTATGEHNTTNWPDFYAKGTGMKGADWCSGIHHTSAVSHRYNVTTNSYIRTGNAGYRACRTSN